MLKRTVAGVLAALFGIGIIVLRDTPVMSIVVAALTVLAAREIEKVIGVKNKAIFFVSLAFSGLVPLFYEFRAELGIEWIPTTAVMAIYCVVLFMLMLTDFKNTKFEEVASVIIATTLVPWSFSTLIFLNDMSETYTAKFDRYHDLFFILFGLFAAGLTDTFAYFSGRLLGKHKMCPSISPGKSWEGMAGSIFASCLVSCAFMPLTHFSCPRALAFGLAAAFCGTLGDLVESGLKRECGVKDSATFMPAGMGGFLDMFDSILFAPAIFSFFL